MDNLRLSKLLGKKEGIRLEFKKCSTAQLPKNLFESICAMLNREGGDIFLGVDDNGTVFGLNTDHVDQLTKDLVNLSNNPHGNGLLLPDSFMPFPKNPLIAKFFIQIGRVDELGSGIFNVYRYLKDYSPGREPQFIEDKLFRTVIPIGDIVNESIKPILIRSDDAVNDAVNDAVSFQVKSRIVEELKWIYKYGGSTLRAIIDEFNIQRATAQRDMKLLKDAGLITFVGSDRSGKYIVTDKGAALF